MTRRTPVVTALGRPLDPGWATNRAVLLLMPVGAVAFAVRSWMFGAGWAGAAFGALAGAGVVLGGWALGRELDPDRQGAAFLTLALCVVVLWLEPGASLVLLFTVLTLVRLVNRTVGIPPTVLDLMAVLGLSAWCAVSAHNPWIALVATVALVVDALLDPGRTRAWTAAGASLLVSGWALMRALGPGATPPLPPEPGPVPILVVGGTALAFLVTLIRTRTVTSRCDRTDELVELSRVRGGMAVALLAALSTLVLGEPGIRAGGLVWATLAGVALWRIPGWRTTA